MTTTPLYIAHPRLITVGEAAQLLGVSKKVTSGLIKSGDLTEVRLSDRGWRRVHEHDVLALARQSGASRQTANQEFLLPPQTTDVVRTDNVYTRI